MTPPQRKSVYSRIAYLIRHYKTFFIAGHRRPDGDSIAAQLVLGSLLDRLHKRYDIYSYDPIPKNLLFLPGASRIRVCKKVASCYDVAFIVECSGQDRMGSIIDLHRQARHVINIDHHTHYNLFGKVNLINPNASSSCEQIHDLFPVLNMEITRENAVCLYTGILTDTGCFRHANTSPLVHRLAAEYLSQGVKPHDMYHHIFEQKRLKDLHAWGAILSGIKTHANGAIAVVEIRDNNIETEDIINFGMMIATVKIAALLQTGTDGKVRVSLRSRGPIDVGKFALRYGGGGHMHAAGCTIPGTIISVQGKIVSLLKKILIPKK